MEFLVTGDAGQAQIKRDGAEAPPVLVGSVFVIASRGWPGERSGCSEIPIGIGGHGGRLPAQPE